MAEPSISWWWRPTEMASSHFRHSYCFPCVEMQGVFLSAFCIAGNTGELEPFPRVPFLTKFNTLLQTQHGQLGAETADEGVNKNNYCYQCGTYTQLYGWQMERVEMEKGELDSAEYKCHWSSLVTCILLTGVSCLLNKQVTLWYSSDMRTSASSSCIPSVHTWY